MAKHLSLKEKYQKDVLPAMQKEFDFKNKMAVPKVEKVILNIGIGQLSKEKEKLEKLKNDLAAISGQAVSVRQSRVSIAGFNVRKGMPVGLAVTLRSGRMYDFLTRLWSVVLPRLRDFRGVPKKGFDGRGNYTLGLAEHSVFPEVDITKSNPHGIEITIVTNAGSALKGRKLLELMGMPFEKD